MVALWIGIARLTADCLLEVVNHCFCAVRLEDFFHEFEVGRVDLISVLSLLGVEGEIKSDLVALLNDWARTCHHASRVEKADAGNRTKVFFHSCEEFLGGIWVRRIGPENDYMAKHRRRN